MQLLQCVTQARHQFFDWKLETRRERSPSAPLALCGSKKPIGGHMTPPGFLMSLHDKGVHPDQGAF